jgi:hypothetical protein
LRAHHMQVIDLQCTHMFHMGTGHMLHIGTELRNHSKKNARPDL